MKLARPDVFHPRIVLAGWARQAAGDGDDAGLVPALRHRGLHARWLAWDDRETRDADLVILRATRDCADRVDEFLAWTTAVANLLNPPQAVAWNLRERYLRDLERAGVPTAAAGGETALIFLQGRGSHAFTRAKPVEPEFEVWDLGYAALASAAEHVGIGADGLLYARVDVNGNRVVRLDLVSPSLGWRLLDEETREQAQRRFVLGVESACERLGLGPLAQGGP
ncbi:hypothetical protein [Mycobacterium sp.]|uniref:hypothetical protein n=1 Tax=Mycobacterium sp. TaxID=1785 RepID=UPI0025E98286|nr:hypothetical protein [Mycobacterium sp.]MBW0012685.1 hypothetical protein [Mycobacterium sp.]